MDITITITKKVEKKRMIRIKMFKICIIRLEREFTCDVFDGEN